MQKLSLNDIEQTIDEARWIVADKKVWELYFSKSSVSQKSIYLVDSPEESKNLRVFEEICDQFLKAGITRKDSILAIGGGATTDLAGFVAASLMRGVKWNIITTTLLGMVDAAIGGKVAINTSYGKNLIGAFWAPENVFYNTEFLESLDRKNLDSGKGEVLKYAFLDESIRKQVLNKESLDSLIVSCAQYKYDLVEKDFKDKGFRQVLNYGHTFGHSFEKNSDLPHGVCVALGIKLSSFLFNGDLSLFEKGVKSLDMEESLELKDKFCFESFLETLIYDKKNEGDKISLIVDKQLRHFSRNELREMIESNQDAKNNFFKA